MDRKAVTKRTKQLHSITLLTPGQPICTLPAFPYGKEKGNTFVIYPVDTEGAWQNAFSPAAYHDELTRFSFAGYFGAV